ncbi:hypothetical protein GCM10008967_32110 [Bacillus carboniphilus]|uniref:Uncharacterized protein n=1 Tax=Bacillus carboniphilus TaxID=86663 RepID=A0ABN0WJ60_9BACI
MIRVLFTISLVWMVLTGCNQKPEVENEIEEERPLVMVENYEELLEGELNFQDAHFQGLERILQYFNQELTDQDLENISEITDFSTYALTDLLQVMDEKGVFILPTYGDAEDIVAGLEKGHPVLVTFYPVGSREVNGIFYGYSEKELIYLDVEAGESRRMELSHLKQATQEEVSLYVPIDDGKEIVSLREESEFYVRLAILEAYYSDNISLFEQIIPIVEEMNLSESFAYPYAYYYLFIKEDPHKAEEFVLSLNPSQDSFGAELQLKYYQLLGNEEEMTRIVQSMHINQNLKVETLNEIVRLGAAMGDEDKVKQAKEALGQKEGL